MPMIVLEVTGDPEVDFSGDCWLYTKFGPEKRYRINGTVPAKYWLPAISARCSLEKAKIVSRLAAKIIRNDIVELQQVSPPPLRWLAVSSTGPWGEARGMSSASRPLWQ
ncbi:MAG: hypothetical protein K9G33_02795 [Sneathiella sp.]|nr:hypothetical protein [Sneathiella sp.]